MDLSKTKMSKVLIFSVAICISFQIFFDEVHLSKPAFALECLLIFDAYT